MISAIAATVGLLGGACFMGLSTTPTSPTTPTTPVIVGEIAPLTIEIGAEASVRIPVKIFAGYRVQANPASSEFLVPLEITFEPIDDIEFGKPLYPPGQPYRLEGAEEDLSTYLGDIEIALPITATASALVEAHNVEGSVRFQACNSRMCLFPSSAPVTFVLNVVPPVSTTEDPRPTQFNQTVPKPSFDAFHHRW